jgi:hypothetical protein
MPQHGNEHDQAKADGSLSPMKVLEAAIRAVPAVKYALGIAGIAAAGGIVISFLGSGRAAIIVLGGMFIAMVLLFVFARLIATRNRSVVTASLVLMWMVVAFFGIFLAFTVTAIAFKVPDAWARILGIEDTPINPKKLLEVPKSLASKLVQGDVDKTVRLTRLLPGDAPDFAERDKVIRGGGAYYSFVRDDHEYGRGSDIKLDQNSFKVGFAGLDYGFFLNAGPGTIHELRELAPEPPKEIDSSRLDAWKFMWAYAPPQDAGDIRKEQRRSDGFSSGGTNLSRNAVVAKGNIYLLRSVLVQQSDVLVGLWVADVLDDGSVVIAWRILKTFDTPIATGQSN